VPADSVSIRIYSGIARFPCDSMAFLYYLGIVENILFIERVSEAGIKLSYTQTWQTNVFFIT